MTDGDFRPFVPTPAQSKIAGATARAHAEARRNSPRGKENAAIREALMAVPFRGITTDGAVVPNLFSLAPQGTPVAAMADSVNRLLALISAEQRAAMSFPVDSQQWRRWQNTEIWLEDNRRGGSRRPHTLRLSHGPWPSRKAR